MLIICYFTLSEHRHVKGMVPTGYHLPPSKGRPLLSDHNVSGIFTSTHPSTHPYLHPPLHPPLPPPTPTSTHPYLHPPLPPPTPTSTHPYLHPPLPPPTPTSTHPYLHPPLHPPTPHRHPSLTSNSFQMCLHLLFQTCSISGSYQLVPDTSVCPDAQGCSQ